ncbi:MAG: hypothetical protein DMF32_00740 [Verrucomicrobia bacterium]|nr:MAG: hypothetical protein DMF32_00740 [Verrucomicrobiota bacterium]
MKHFLLACFIPMTLTAQNMQQLTEQLGKTVLCGGMGAIHGRNNIETDVYPRNFRKCTGQAR